MARRGRPPMPSMVAKKHYPVRDIYWITQQATQTILAGSGADCDKVAAERIMLAITEVNGCEVCSYAHSRWALDMGMSEVEVRALLGGDTRNVPTEELAGVAFGQHYADARGRPDPDTWDALVRIYGDDRARCVLRAVRMMMWGNAMGIPLSSLLARLRGSPDSASGTTGELATLLGGLMITPAAVIHAVVSHLRGLPIEPQPRRPGAGSDARLVSPRSV